MDEEQLRELAEKFGNVLSLKVVTDKSGCPKGFGFVDFETPEQAQKVCYCHMAHEYIESYESSSPIVVKLGDIERMFDTAFYWSTLLYTTSYNTYSVSLHPWMKNFIALKCGYRESISWDEIHYFLPECTVLRFRGYLHGIGTNPDQYFFL